MLNSTGFQFVRFVRKALLKLLAASMPMVGLLSPVRADVIYRETFGMPPGSTADAFAPVFDWQRFDNNGLAITTTGSSSGVNFSALGRPVDVANVSAGPNSDGTFGAYTNGILYFGATPSPSLGFTPEFSINPSLYAPGSIVFSFWEGNNTAPHTFRLLVRVGGLWYASTTTFTTPAVALTAFGSQAVFKSIVYDPAPANWLQVNFNGDFILGGTPGTGTTVNSTAGAVSLGAAPGAPLNGTITAFGVYGDNGGSGTGNRRIDTFQVDASLVSLGKNVTWVGSPNADWDTVSTNWVTTNSVVTNYANGDVARFDDTGVTGHINLLSFVSPGSTTVSNNSIAYFFEGPGIVSGGGSLTKQGSGTLTVLVPNAYSGPTTISGGTIAIGDGGSVGNLGSGNITNNGAIVINRNNAITLANNVSGSGSITVNAASPLTITGAGSLTGPTVLNSGTLVFNGAWLGGGLLTNAPGTTLSGRGTNSGLVDVSGQLSPGTSAGTFTCGALTLESGATVVFELGSSSTVGGGVNDLLQVNGNLTLNNNSVTISLFGAPQTNVAYRLVNYTGTRSGSFNPAVVLPGGSHFTAVISYDDGAKQVNVTFGGSSANLRWNETGGGSWEVGVTSNWLNQATAGADAFFQLDNALLDDTTGVAIGLNIDVAVAPNVLTNDSSVNAFSIYGTGKITGSGRLVKKGSSTLTLTTSNDFSGGVSIEAGAVRFGAVTAPGTGVITVMSNALAIAAAAHANNITLAGGNLGAVSGLASLGGELTNVAGTVSTISMTDPQNNTVNSEMNFTGTLHGGGTLLIIPGTANTTVDSGVGFRLRGTGTSDFSGTIVLSNNVKGEIQSSVAGPFSPAGTAKIIATCGLADLNGTATAPVSGGFSEFNIRNNSTTNSIFGNDLELVGQGLVTLNPLGSAPTNAINTMGNLKIGAGQELGVIRNSTQPQIVFFRSVTLTGGTATFSPKTPGFGAPTATGSDLSLSNITQQAAGSGIVMNGLRTLTLTGTNGYNGATTVSNGVLALVGASSLSNSPVLTVVSPGALSVTGRGDGKLTLVNGQTLQGNGAITGALDVGVGATVAPGLSIGTLTVSGAIVLHGTTRIELDKSTLTQDLLSTPASINYGGTLSLTNLTQDTTPLAAGDSFKIFDSAGSTYVGSFAGITPATPGPQLVWDTTSLNLNGTIKVALSQPGISSIAIIGSNIVLSGTNGTSSGTYSVLTSTDLTLPLASWPTQSVGNFLPNGSFSYTNVFDPNTPLRFFRIKMP